MNQVLENLISMKKFLFSFCISTALLFNRNTLKAQGPALGVV